MVAWLVVGALAAPRPELRLHLGKVPMKGRSICYPSGLQVHAVSRPGTGLVTVSTAIEGGSSSELDGERGAAHLAEHLWFQAHVLGDVPLEQSLSALSADGFTLPDATVYVTVGAPADLVALLQIEGQRLADPLVGVGPPTFDAERAKVHNETLWRGEHAVRRATRELEDALWPTGFPYRGMVATLADNDALTFDAVQGWLRRVYVPASTVIRIEGDVDLANIDAALEQGLPVALRLGDKPSDCTHPVFGGDPPAPTGTELVQVEAGVLAPELLFGWSLPAGYGDSDVIGRAAAAWIQTREQELLAPEGLRVDCRYEPRRRASVLTCRATLGTKTADEVANAFGAGLRDLWTQDLAQRAEWVDVLAGLLDDALVAGDSFDDDALTARSLASLFGGDDFDPTSRSLDAVMSFQEAALVEFGRRYLGRPRMVTVSVVPGQVPVEERSGRIEALAGLGAPVGSAWTAPVPALEGWTTETLPNGLVVWVVAREGGAPLSRAALGFDRGAAFGSPGAAATQAQRWTAVVPLSYAELVNASATRTATSIGPTDTRVSALGPSGNLDAQLYLVRQLGVAPTFGPSPPPAVPPPVDPEVVAADDRLARLFPGHALGTGSAYASASRSEAADWRQAVLRPDDGALVMVGWFAPSEATALATRYFGKWKAPKDPLPLLPALPAAPERALTAVKADATLATVEVSCRLPGRIAVNDAALDVVGFLVDQGARQSLRVHGGAYLAEAEVVDLGSRTGLLELRTAVGPAEAGDALSAMYGLLELVAAGPSDGVLEWARQAVKSRFARSVGSTSSSFEVALDAARTGLTLDQLRGYPARVDAVDADAVRQVLADCVNHEATTYVGPQADLAPYEPVWK